MLLSMKPGLLFPSLARTPVVLVQSIGMLLSRKSLTKKPPLTLDVQVLKQQIVLGSLCYQSNSN
jgi:hypothetical protein